jgi:hypothetical protein
MHHSYSDSTSPAATEKRGSLLALGGSLGGVTRLVFAALMLAACTSTIVPATVWKTVVPRQVTRTDQVGNVLSPVTDAATWTELEARPLRLASLAGVGGTCPVSPSATLPGSAVGAAAGDGPVYPVTGAGWIGLGPAGAGGLQPGKILWLARPDYAGPALIRGARLDGPGDVRFATGDSVLRFDLDTHTRAGDATEGSVLGWRYLPSNVYVPAAGCYGFQIDLPDRTISITLVARDQSY